MRNLLIALAVGALLVPAAMADSVPAKEPVKAADPVKAVELKDLKLKANEGGIGKPTVITSEDELAKAVSDKDAVAAIKKQVDFKTHQVVFFSWSGSGGDKLTFETKGDKKVEVVFNYKAGLTKDLRPHFHMFVIPTDAGFKLEGVK